MSATASERVDTTPGSATPASAHSDPARITAALAAIDPPALVARLTATSGRTIDIVSPVTGAVLHTLPRSDAADVARAAEAARAAQRAWRDAGPAHRRRVLLRAHDELVARKERLLDAVQLETGKTRGQAYEEWFNAAAAIRYAALSAGRAVRVRRRRAGIPLVMQARVRVSPKQLVGIITPWNYPPSLTAMDVAPALAVGCAVVQKADDHGALSILLVREAFAAAGLPEAVWGVVAGPGEEIGSAVIDAADHVAFTGSTATGRTVAERAARRLIGASLELGGKNPLLVLDDVDVEKAAADAAYACFSSAGQLCVSTERVIVLRGVADRFVSAFAERVAGLTPGVALDYGTDVGSLTTAAQLERVREHVDDAVAKGARVLAGGRALPEIAPFVYAPTVLAEVPEEAICARQETFGPVVSVTVVDDEEAAIARANDTEYGLAASVLTGSRRRGRRVATRLVAGSVNINEGYRASFSAVDAPMGGRRQSGLGRRNGAEGLARYLETTTVAEATGLLQLPRTGAEFRRLVGPMALLLRVLRIAHRR
ncbi:MAG: aldehyde dehydrogenase family protein [Actinomycetales bacterium]|nr:aldehyde dehydrogenase family protein [Actinomycetales bacterium]